MKILALNTVVKVFNKVVKILQFNKVEKVK